MHLNEEQLIEYRIKNTIEYIVNYKHNGRLAEPCLLQRRYSKLIAKCGPDIAYFRSMHHALAARCIKADVDIKILSGIS